jgi:hypothetical protein
MMSIILYQIFFLKNNTFVLFEIFLVCFLLHLIYEVGYYGLRGNDPYIDYNFFKSILSDHHFTLIQSQGVSVNGWPMIHILSSATSFTTKISPLLIAKFLPLFISSIIVMPLFLVVQELFKNKKVALFSCLIFGTIPKFISFEGLFVRETYGLFIIILFFYILYISKERSDYHFGLLSIILIPVIVFSHHLSSFMLIVLLAIYIVVSKLLPFLSSNQSNLRKKLSDNYLTVFLLILFSTLSYWTFNSNNIINLFKNIFSDFFSTRQVITTYAEKINLISPIVTLRGNIIYYGFFFFHISFCFILLIRLLLIKKFNQKSEEVAFTLFLYFCLFYAFLALFILGSLPFPDRFLPFGWMFGIIPLVGLLLLIKNGKLKGVLVVLLISFCIFNLYNIEPEYYTGNASIKVVSTEKDYLIAEQFNFPEKYYGYPGVAGAIYDVQGIEQGFGSRNIEKIGDISNFSSIAIINDKMYLDSVNILKEKSIKDYTLVIEILSYKNQKNVDKICDFSNIYILRSGVS